MEESETRDPSTPPAVIPALTEAGECRSRRLGASWRLTVLLMDIAFLPFAASVLAQALRQGHGQRTAVVLHGVAFEAAILFNVIWWYAKHDRRLLGGTIDAAGVRAIGRRFQLALGWIATGTLVGAWIPALGVAVIAAFIPYYWLPIRGEIAKAKGRRGGGGT